MPINSKHKGNRYEQWAARVWRVWFPNTLTSRNSNLQRDAQKVDLTGTDPFNVQCKAVERSLNLHELLSEMPTDQNYNLVMHKRKGQGTVVAIKWDDFAELITMLKREEIL